MTPPLSYIAALRRRAMPACGSCARPRPRIIIGPSVSIASDRIKLCDLVLDDAALVVHRGLAQESHAGLRVLREAAAADHHRPQREHRFRSDKALRSGTR